MNLITYKKNIKEYFTSDASIDVFFYWKARVGLYALLKAMGVKRGDEVILPAYTCVVVPNAILYLGAIPVYIDVSLDNYNLLPNAVETAITKRTKVLICQNTYGLSTDLEVLNVLARKRKLLTIEDCTHGFGGFYNTIPNGLSCDAAIYSTQWNKPFSTGIGGFAITNNTSISCRLKKLNEELVSPSAKELLNLKILYFVRRFLINEVSYWPLVQFYRWLSRYNLVVGSSSGGEIASLEMPARYFKAFSHTQAKEGLRNLPDLKQDLVRRKQSAELYTNFLIQRGKNHVDKKWFINHSFLKYPLLVNHRSNFMLLAEKHRIALGEWFMSPLHPVEGDLSLWRYDRKNYPVADYLSSHVVNLPTTPADINKVINFLEKYIDYILPVSEQRAINNNV
jgi:dTDP-4-amino-4,6-dideoxygalactose transaminase